MTSSNRLVNRLILLIVGLLALAAAALVGWRAAASIPLPFPVPELPIRIPEDAGTGELAAVAGVCAAVIVLAVAWILTRGRGRRRLAIDSPGVQIDTRAVEAMLRSELASSPDIAGTTVQAYRVRRRHMLLVTVQARTHPDLRALTASVRAAVARTDEQLGSALPLVLHVTTGLRTALTGSRTTH